MVHICIVKSIVRGCACLFTVKRHKPFFLLPLTSYEPEIYVVIHQTWFLELPLASNWKNILSL